MCYAYRQAMTPDRLDPETIKVNLERAKQRRDHALAELSEATAELEWWRAGQRMFDPEGATEAEIEEAADAVLREVIPDGFETRNPTLRQAMLLGMRARPRSDWSVTELYDMLVLHGWIDPDAKDQGKRISDMAAVMISDKVLERAGRGVYRLPEPLAAALERRLRPINDYRLSGTLGFPVPSRPAPRGA